MVDPPDTVRQATLVAGRYRLGHELGRGGHGVVYDATQLPLGRAVALKMLLPEAALVPGALERFAREAALAQRLTHPHTVQILDFGQTEDGLPFIVLERLRGRTLEDELARGRLSVTRAAHVGAQCLKSLTEAHAQGIVHRDIKPSNIFLVEHTGESDFVKVLDFGVARLTASEPGDRAITRDGQMVGTPSYMAPEQVNGQDVTPATDIYALGLVLAEAMSGVCVMADASPIKVWTRQASSEPVPLPEVVLASPLGAVLAKATQKAPEARYASCSDMLYELERALASAASAPTDPFAAPYIPAAPAAPSTPSRGSQEAARTSTQHLAPTWPSAPPPALTSAPAPAPSLSPPPWTAPRSSPHVSAPSGPRAQPPPSHGAIVTLVISSVIGVGALAFIALLWSGVAIAVRDALVDGGAAATTAAEGDAAAVPALPASPPEVPRGSLSAYTPETLRAKLEALGWHVNGDSVHPKGAPTVVFVLSRDTTSASVTYLDFDSEVSARSAEVNLRSEQPNIVATRDGKRVFGVVIMVKAHSASDATPDPEGARRLLSELAR